MKILMQIGILFGLCWVSQILSSILPFAFPASVISLILLLVLLLVRAIRVDHIREESDFLLSNLPFFFIPVSVGIMNYTDVILDHGAAFVTICAVSLFVTYGATVWAVHLTNRLLHRGEQEAHRDESNL